MFSNIKILLLIVKSSKKPLNIDILITFLITILVCLVLDYFQDV